MRDPSSLASVAMRFSQLDPETFRSEIETLWTSAGKLAEAVSEQVEMGGITTVQGVAIVACITGQLFGYQEFHREPTAAQLATELVPALAGSHSA